MKRTTKNPTEQQEAERFAAWLRVRGYDFTHIPNETGGSSEAKRRAIRMKRAGTSPGFPDYLIFTGEKNIAIELKSLTGRATKEQLAWLAVLAAHGFECAVCQGVQDCIDFVNSVVGGVPGKREGNNESSNSEEVF